MKKQFLLVGLAVAAMTSCTSDEMLEQVQPVQKAIGFESFVNKSTRAVDDLNSSNLQEFYVFGYYGTDTEVFTNAAVLRSNAENANGWNVQEKELWTKSSYTFAAYADGIGTGSVEETIDADKLSNVSLADGTLTLTNYSLKNKDLIAAHATQDNTNGDKQDDVSFSFSHLLSKVSFKFKYTDTENDHIKMNISNIKLSVPLTATCTSTGSTTSWESHTGTKEYELADLSEVGETSLPTSPEEYYVIPEAAIAEGTILSFTVKYYDDTQSDKPEVETKDYTLKLNTGSLNDATLSTWDANNIYAYTVNLPFDPLYIDFAVGSVGDWTTYNPTISPNDNSVGE